MVITLPLKRIYRLVLNRLPAARRTTSAWARTRLRAVFDDYGKPFPELMIATDDVLYYPMPLQFYCHGQAKALQAQLNVALNEHQRSGNLSALFEQHFSAQIFALGLPHRRIHRLHNPCLKDQPSLNEAQSAAPFEAGARRLKLSAWNKIALGPDAHSRLICNWHPPTAHQSPCKFDAE